MTVNAVLEYRPPLRDRDPLKDGIFEEIVNTLTAEGTCVVDRSRRILFWNEAAEGISGHDAADVVGGSCGQLLLQHCDASGSALCGTRCPLEAVMVDGLPRTSEVFLLHHDGHRVPIEMRASAVVDHRGRIIGAVELFHDKTQPLTVLAELRNAQQREQLDPLTGIGNRRLIEESLRALTSAAPPAGGATGVIFLDIDHFKSINDRHGHMTGDRVIREVALTIAGELRSSDVVGRWGGEEFVVISPGSSPESIVALGERIRGLVAATPIPAREQTIEVTVSLGATVVRWPESAAELVDRADRLMYASKHHGRNRLTAG